MRTYQQSPFRPVRTPDLIYGTLQSKVISFLLICKPLILRMIASWDEASHCRRMEAD